MKPATVDDRPAAVSGVLAVAVGVVALLLVDADGTSRGLALVVGSLLVVAAGRSVGDRGYRYGGLFVLALGLLGHAAAVWVTVAGASPSAIVQSLPGVLGVAVLGLALVPLRDGRERAVLVVGTAGVGASIFLAGTFRTTGFTTLTLATAGVVAAWALGENAIAVGEQLGRRATTRRAEGVYAATTALVGGVAVVVAHAVERLATSGLSREAFVLSFVALLLLGAALGR